MHTNDARKAGESEDRLHMVAVWREARHFFSARERAALALTEAVTLVADGGVPDDVYAEAAAQFDEQELAHVLSLILTINTWNRVALSTAKVAGTTSANERRALTGGGLRPSSDGRTARSAPAAASCPSASWSTAAATARPSAIAHTMSDWPRAASPAAYTPGTVGREVARRG